MKRIVLFLVTNLAVMLVLSVVTSLLGVNRFLTSNGLNLGMLLAFAAVIGFGGSTLINGLTSTGGVTTVCETTSGLTPV